MVAVRMVIHKVAGERGRIGLIALNAKRAFVYRRMRRRVYIEPPGQDPFAKNDNMGRLAEAMHGTRDAPQF